MKKFNRAAFHILILASILAFSSCGKKSDPDPEEKSSAATATVNIGNGEIISFSGDHSTVISALQNKLGIGFLDTEKGIYIYLAINSSKLLEEKTYSINFEDIAKTGSSAYLTLEPMDTDLFPDGFDTRKNIDGEFGSDGRGTVNITSLNGNQVEGTFTATLYSDKGDEARITKGKFKTNINYTF